MISSCRREIGGRRDQRARVSRRSATLHGGDSLPDLTLRTHRGEITVREALPKEPPFSPGSGRQRQNN
jgi:hypothetical protein